MQKSEFEQDLAIDPNELDVQCAGQGELFFKWAEKSVEAKKEADQAKFRMEVLFSQLSNKARKDPASFGLEKLTEAGITTAVKISAEYQEAYEEWIDAKSAADMLGKAVEAMEQKKRMLEVLITLHGQQYFAGPSVPRNLVDAWNDKKEARSSNVKKKTKIRRRKREDVDKE